MRSPACGVLLHVTSLPGPGSSGDLGPEARRFVDSLAKAGVGWWQTLPIGPAGCGGSPYDSPSAFAGAPELISLDDLGDRAAVREPPLEPGAPASGSEPRRERLRRLFERQSAAHRTSEQAAFRTFCEREQAWLEDYALFAALSQKHQPRPRHQWPLDVRTARGGAVAAARRELRDDVRFESWLQWVFSQQWAALRRFAHQRGVRLIGDVPIFVASHSADVWAHPELFALDADARPSLVAAVPPDHFSPHGQLWGNPVYRWSVHRRDGFAWWRRRLRAGLERFDLLRIDHFRGLVANWRVAAGSPTAERGFWSRGPARELWRAFESDPRLALKSADGWPTLFAEDLGHITPAVRRALRDCDLWGTRVLQFAADRRSEHHPRNVGARTVYYTGTHDNDTTLGWLNKMEAGRRSEISGLLGLEPTASTSDLCREVVRAALASRAQLVVLPLQDILCLDSDARMNTPGTTVGNWQFRAPTKPLPEGELTWLSQAVRSSGRAAAGGERPPRSGARSPQPAVPPT